MARVRSEKVKSQKSKIKTSKFPDPFKLDIACGQSKTPGFFGVDIAPGEGVDLVYDLEKFPWPFPDASVDEAICNHYIEHTKDLISFMNELYRILKPGARCMINAPYYASMRAWQDPTHTRAISESTFLYYNKDWLTTNKLDHYPIHCDFDFQYGYNITPDWANRSEEARNFAIRHYINVISDIQVVLTKRPQSIDINPSQTA
jgi:predicted SAM-dependent methyltransferase